MAGKVRKLKAGQGEGSFTALPDGRYRWRVMVTTQAGERRHPSGTARNLTEARKAVRAVREAAQVNALPPREKVTVEQLVTAYIEHRAPSLKGRTVKNYRAILQRNITPSLGHLKAQGVTVARLREYYAALSAQGKGQGDSVRRQVHNLLHAAYRLALADGVVTVNPAAQARPMYTARGSAAQRLKAFTPEEAVKFYQAARADRWGWPLAFMLATGLRPGEALGLRWAEVTFNPDGSATVSVERTRSVVSGEVYEDTPKTERGRRVLMVKGDAVGILQAQRAQAEREAGARLTHNGRPYQVTGYVFTSRAGTPYRPDNLRRPMNRLCAAAGVPVLTPHKLRHTYTSVMAASGHSVEVLSAQLGHGNATITRNFYRHVFDGEREGLTYDPTPPAPHERVKVRARRAVGTLQPEPSHPSVAPAKKRGQA
jgi:integrase